MTSFQLAGLDPVLLEKIITKLDEKSYFRMRQTCREMDEFIRKKENISVHVGRTYDYDLGYDKDELRQLGIFSPPYKEVKKDVEGFYEIRFSWLKLSAEHRFDQLCDFLRKHRVTCEKLDMVDSRLTKEKCVTLLNILKPASVELSSEQSNRYEALFQSKTLKRFDLKLNRKDVGNALPRLLSAFSEVDIEVTGDADRYDMLRIILQFLCPQPPPNLKSFHFRVTGDQFVNFKTMEKKFREFDLVVAGEGRRVPRISVDFEDGFSCRVKIRDLNMDVYYDQDGYSKSESDDSYTFYDSDYCCRYDPDYFYQYDSSYGYISD